MILKYANLAENKMAKTIDEDIKQQWKEERRILDQYFGEDSWRIEDESY